MDTFLYENKTYIIVIIVVVAIILYFWIDYQTRSIFKQELQKQQKNKQRKMKLLQIQQQKLEQQLENQHNEKLGTDSYVDPAERFHNETPPENAPRTLRQKSENILMRDIDDGARQ